MGDEGARHAVEQGELVKSSPQIAQTGGSSKEGLGDVALAQVEVLGEDVAESKGAGSGACLQGQDGGGIAEYVLLLLGGPLLHGNIEVEGLGRVRKDLIGQLIGDLLDEQLSGHIGGTRDGGESDRLAERQRRGSLGELGASRLAVRRWGLNRRGSIAIVYLAGQHGGGSYRGSSWDLKGRRALTQKMLDKYERRLDDGRIQEDQGRAPSRNPGVGGWWPGPEGGTRDTRDTSQARGGSTREASHGATPRQNHNTTATRRDDAEDRIWMVDEVRARKRHSVTREERD